MYFVERMTGLDLGAILQSLLEKQLTGALEATSNNTFATLWIREGRVVYAHSSDSIGLGEALLSLGLLKAAQLEDLTRTTDGSYFQDAMLDAILIERKLIAPQVITYIRAFQIAETLFSIVEWETVGYELKEDLHPKVGCPDLLPLNYNWLQAVTQYAPDWPRLRIRVGLPQQLFRQRPLKRQELELDRDEEKLYLLVDGVKRSKELVLWSGLNYFTAHKVLYQLLEMGAIDVVEKENFRPSQFQSKRISEKLQPLLKLPGVVNAFLVDRSGKMIVQDRGTKELTAQTNTMATIFVKTVEDFERNLPQDSETGRIEQVFVEKMDGNKILLLIAGSVILVIEAMADVNWGILRLTGQRTLMGVRLQLFVS